jgi:3-(3-hydroxy-phenyl)propionate hydroxylase
MPGAGERFIQPCVNGQLLDDITGSGWRLFSRAPIDAPTEITVVLITEGAIEDWLTAHDAQAVLVRPDHYVFGTGAPADLLAQLEGKLRP